MKKLIIFAFTLFSTIVYAQDFKFDVKSATKVKIGTIKGSLTVEGYAGKEILISGTKCTSDNEATEGLKLISNNGLSDNTDGFCLNITETDGVVSIKGVSNKSRDIKVMIPEKMNIIIRSEGYHAKGIKVNNVKSELEINSEYPPVTLTNVTGPVVCNATYGQVKAIFDKINQQKPISIIATYSNLDVTMPADTKANLKLESDYGDIFTDFDIKSTNTKENNEDMEKLNNRDVSGTINSGGVEIHLESPYKNVFLRKKK